MEHESSTVVASETTNGTNESGNGHIIAQSDFSFAF